MVMPAGIVSASFAVVFASLLAALCESPATLNAPTS